MSIKEDNKTKEFIKWYELYNTTVSYRNDIDARIPRREDLYNGSRIVHKSNSNELSSKPVQCYNNMCFELIETQINNGIPQPKVTPRLPKDRELAEMTENFLRLEMDRMESETMNDSAERGVLKQGSAFYLVGWDNNQHTGTTQGELFLKYYPLKDVYPQGGITNMSEAEYVFLRELISIKEIKKLYGVTVPDIGEFKGRCTLITCYYLNDDGYLSRYGWVEPLNLVVFNEDAYELRKIKVCKDCGQPMLGDKCSNCGSEKFEYKTLKEETLPEDVIEYSQEDPKNAKVIAKKDTKMPYYKIGQLPVVLRKNVSNGESLYGISDIDLLEPIQEATNKINTKLVDSVLKAGSVFLVPKNVHIPNTDETLKKVTYNDPKEAEGIKVVTIQPSIQQDNIIQQELYEMGKNLLGITDSYQGKRDTTAESGKAKQVAAAQAAGRLESKRRMKDAAYADIYKLLFKFALAYSDEPRTYSKVTPTGELLEATFSRYNFLAKNDKGELYYKDDLLFSVDDASTLMTNREALWSEASKNFSAGTFGNIADYRTLSLYWSMMQGYDYPLAKQALSTIQQMANTLDPALQEVIANNPQILNAVKQIIKEGESGNNANSK